MTTNETGVTIWFEATGLTLAMSRVDGQVMKRGQSLVVTPELRALATDRLGNCVYDLTPEQQLRRFGKVHFHVGEAPADLRPTPGSFEEDDARVAALQAAALLPTDQERRIAAAKARSEYGSSSEASSRTIMEYNP